MTDLVPYEDRSPVHRDTDDWALILPAVGDLAGKIAGTSFVPKALRGKPAEVAACVLTGREIGVGPMEALQKIHVIDGRPTMSAELMRAQVLKAGHQIHVAESTASKAVVTGRRKGEEQWTRVTYTIEDAKRAGLTNKENWRKYPRQMLTGRASAELCRLIFPDAIGGFSYTTEEAQDIADTEPPPEEQPKPRTRRRATRSAAPPPQPEEPELDEPIDAETVDEVTADPDTGEIIEPISEAQMKKLHAGFNDLGITDRQERLDYSAAIIGRQIESSKDLSKDEARRIIDKLDEALAGTGNPDPAEAVDPTVESAWGERQ